MYWLPPDELDIYSSSVYPDGSGLSGPSVNEPVPSLPYSYPLILSYIYPTCPTLTGIKSITTVEP
jgi:hypothetical protein